MKPLVAYVALQQFACDDPMPRQRLIESGFEVRENPFGRRLRGEEMAEVLRDADAVLAGIEPYTASVLAALPKLRCISRCGVGLDSIDLEAAQQRGIAVYRTANEVVDPVAQLTIAMMLALARNLPHHMHDAREGRWVKRTGALLSEWTIGIVGFGRIGQAVVGLLRPFGSRVLIHDPGIDLGSAPSGLRSVPLDALLAEADLVSLHADRAQGAGALLGAAELARMKRGSFLVNTARGHLVDQDALLAALQSGRLTGAALDVFEPEPYTGPLAQLPQVLCTPHVASLTRSSRAAMELRAAQQIVEHFARMSHAPMPVSTR